MERHHLMGIILMIGFLGAWIAAVVAHITYPDLYLLPPILGWIAGAMYTSAMWVIMTGRKLGIS